MAENIVNTVEIKLKVTDEASGPSATTAAAIKELGNASEVAAAKAQALAEANRAVRASGAAVTEAQRNLAKATKSGDSDKISGADAKLQQATAAAADNKAAQAAAAEALQQARQAQSAARAAVASAERDDARAAASMAKQQAAQAANAAQLDAVNGERKTELAVVEQLNTSVTQLEERRATASAADQVGIDAEIVSIRKSIASREAEVFALDEKAIRLREVAAVAVAASEEERAAIRAATDARLTEIRVEREQQIAARAATPAPGAGASGGATGIAGLLGRAAPLLTVAGATAAFAAAYKTVEQLREALDRARESDEANARLGAALGGNASRTRDVQQSVVDVSGSTTYGKTQLTDLAGVLASRGVQPDKMAATLRAVADTAAAVHKPLEEVANQVAATFGGFAGELGERLPQIRALTAEELKAGKAVEVLTKAYGGQSAAFAQTDAGREAAAVRDISQAWEDVGRALLPIERMLVSIAAKSANVFAAPFRANAADWTNFAESALDTVLNTVSPVPIEAVGLGSGYAAATDSARVKQTLDEGADAAAHQKESEAKLLQIVADAQQQIRKLRAASVAQQVAEEFKLRKAGIDQWLQALADAQTAEKSPLVEQQADVQRRLANEQATANRMRAAIPALQAKLQPIDPAASPAQQLQANTTNTVTSVAIGLAQSQLKAATDNMAPLLQRSKELEQRLDELNRKGGIERLSALQDAAKQAETVVGDAYQHATTVVDEAHRDWANGLITQGEEQQRVNDAMQAYAKAVELAREEFDKLKTLTNDPATLQIISDAQQKVLSDAAKSGVTIAPGGTPHVQDELDTQVKPGAIRSQAGATQAGAEELQQTAFSGIVEGLSDVELHSKSAGEALKNFALGLAKSFMDVANQRLAETLVAGLSGGKSGGGLFGLLGGVATGDPAGGLAKVGIGSATATATNAAQPVAAASTGPIMASASGSAVTDAAGPLDKLGEKVMQVGSTVASGIGTITSSIGSAVSSVVSGLGQALSSILSSVGQGIGNAAGGIAGSIGGAFASGFATGGYTGDGHPAEPAGVVHGQEFVLTAAATKHYGMSMLHRINQRQFEPMLRTTMYQMPYVAPGRSLVSPSGADFAEHAAKIGEAAGAIADAASDLRSQPPVLLIGDHNAAQITGNPAVKRQMAREMTRDPEYAKAIRAHSRG